MTNKFPQMSIIMPCYNTEKYLEESLNSILNQSFKDFELICINDCSSDKSLEILENYAQKDSRIKIIDNKKNIGVGAVRNLGLDLACGKYLCAVDSDDKLLSGALEKIFNTLEENRLDILIFNYVKYSEEDFSMVESEDTSILKQENLCQKIVTKETDKKLYHLGGYCWNKVYNREFIKCNKIRFPELNMWEDVRFYINAVNVAQRIMCIDDCLYRYTHPRKHSIVTSSCKYLDEFNSCLLYIEELKTSNIEDKDYISLYFYCRILYIVGHRNFYKQSYDEYLTMRELLKDKDFSLITNDTGDVAARMKLLNTNSRLKWDIIRFLKLYFPEIFNILIRFKKLLFR